MHGINAGNPCWVAWINLTSGDGGTLQGQGRCATVMTGQPGLYRYEARLIMELNARII